MVNGLKTDMEHKNTNDKNEYHFQLPEVVVKGKMPGWMRRQLGMALHRNPALFRKCMKNATSLEEKQFYFNLAFNAAREEAGQQFVQAALTAAGVISAISTAGVSLAAATSFGRQAALLGRGALLKGSTYAGRIASSIEAASLRGGMAVQNTIMRSATHLRTLSNITGRMLYPKGLSFDTMLLMGASDLRIIVKVLLLESRTSLITGATIAIGTILGYSAMAGSVGGGGLGDIAIRYGYYRYESQIMIVTVILLVVLVQVFQSIGMIIASKLDKRRK